MSDTGYVPEVPDFYDFTDPFGLGTINPASIARNGLVGWSELLTLPSEVAPLFDPVGKVEPDYHEHLVVPKRPKTATKTRSPLLHNVVEQRYRNNINDKITQLRDLVPLLRCVEGLPENLEGLRPAKKLNKATVLTKAIEYIQHLERKNTQLAEQNDNLQRIILQIQPGEPSTSIGASSSLLPAMLPFDMDYLKLAMGGLAAMTGFSAMGDFDAARDTQLLLAAPVLYLLVLGMAKAGLCLYVVWMLVTSVTHKAGMEPLLSDRRRWKARAGMLAHRERLLGNGVVGAVRAGVSRVLLVYSALRSSGTDVEFSAVVEAAVQSNEPDWEKAVAEAVSASAQGWAAYGAGNAARGKRDARTDDFGEIEAALGDLGLPASTTAELLDECVAGAVLCGHAPAARLAKDDAWAAVRACVAAREKTTRETVEQGTAVLATVTEITSVYAFAALFRLVVRLHELGAAPAALDASVQLLRGCDYNQDLAVVDKLVAIACESVGA